MRAVEEFNMNGNGTNAFTMDSFKDVFADVRPAVTADSNEATKKNDGVTMDSGDISADAGVGALGAAFGIPFLGGTSFSGAAINAVGQASDEAGYQQANKMEQPQGMKMQIGRKYSDPVMQMRAFDLTGKAKFNMTPPTLGGVTGQTMEAKPVFYAAPQAPRLAA